MRTATTQKKSNSQKVRVRRSHDATVNRANNRNLNRRCRRRQCRDWKKAIVETTESQKNKTPTTRQTHEGGRNRGTCNPTTLARPSYGLVNLPKGDTIKNSKREDFNSMDKSTASSKLSAILATHSNATKSKQSTEQCNEANKQKRLTNRGINNFMRSNFKVTLKAKQDSDTPNHCRLKHNEHSDTLQMHIPTPKGDREQWRQTHDMHSKQHTRANWFKQHVLNPQTTSRDRHDIQIASDNYT